MEVKAVRISIPADCNLILGQSHFIKTVEDLYEILVGSVPSIKFGIAFNEASGPCLVRREGNDSELVNVAVENIRAVGAGHAFLVVLKQAYPINVLNGTLCARVVDQSSRERLCRL